MKKIKDYPRPQLVRNEWQNLNGKWNFIFDDENIGEEKQYFNQFPKSKEILVPFTYETKMSGINDETVHENIWYSNNVKLTLNKNKRTILHFEGSDFITKLWINGKFVGKNIGGYHRFSFDISKYIINGENNITIKVEDSLSKSQPRGKQRYKNESFKCWYIQTTGIWKTVWLETVPKNYIISVKNTPNFDEKNINIELDTNISLKEIENYEVETEIKYDNETINVEKNKMEDSIFKYQISICNDKSNHIIKEWAPEHPYLYDISYILYKNILLKHLIKLDQ